MDWLAKKNHPPKSGRRLASSSVCSELFPVGVWREHTDGSAAGTGGVGEEACGVWLPSRGRSCHHLQ